MAHRLHERARSCPRSLIARASSSTPLDTSTRQGCTRAHRLGHVRRREPAREHDPPRAREPAAPASSRTTCPVPPSAPLAVRVEHERRRTARSRAPARLARIAHADRAPDARRRAAPSVSSARTSADRGSASSPTSCTRSKPSSASAWRASAASYAPRTATASNGRVARVAHRGDAAPRPSRREPARRALGEDEARARRRRPRARRARPRRRVMPQILTRRSRARPRPRGRGDEPAQRAATSVLAHERLADERARRRRAASSARDVLGRRDPALGDDASPRRERAAQSASVTPGIDLERREVAIVDARRGPPPAASATSSSASVCTSTSASRPCARAVARRASRSASSGRSATMRSTASAPRETASSICHGSSTKSLSRHGSPDAARARVRYGGLALEVVRLGEHRERGGAASRVGARELLDGEVRRAGRPSTATPS